MPPRPRHRYGSGRRMARLLLPLATLGVVVGLTPTATSEPVVGASVAGTHRATPAGSATPRLTTAQVTGSNVAAVAAWAPSAATHLAGAPRARTPGTGLEVTLESVTPAVATADQSVVIDVALGNASGTTIPAGSAVARLDTAELRTSAQVAAWFDGATPGNGREVARATHPVVDPGARVALRLTIPRAATLHSSPFGAVPVSITVGGESRHTVVGYQRAKEYQPISLSTLVAVTPDPDPALFGPVGAERTAAWQRALAPGGRLDRLRAVLAEPGVTAAVDPTLLRRDSERAAGNPDATTSAPTASGPATTDPTGADTSTPTSSQFDAAQPDGTPGSAPDGSPERTPGRTATPSESTEPAPTQPAPTQTAPTQTDPTQTGPGEEEARMRTAFAERLIDAVAGRSPLVLPGADADVSQLPHTPAGRLAALLRAGSAAAAAVDGVSGVLWPADTRWSPAANTRYAAWSPRPAVLTDRASLEWDVDQGNAGRRSTGGVPLIAIEPGLSRALATAAAPGASAAARQELVAETLALLGESPGLARTAVAALPRGAEVDPTAFRGVLDLAEQVPWLDRASLATVIDQARAAPAATVPRTPLPPDIPAPPASPLTASALRHLDTLHSQARLAAAVRDDGRRIAPEWSDRLDQLLSVRWRAAAPAFRTVLTVLDAEITQTSHGVRVAPQTITFLADRGRLQVTVLNDLPIGVHSLRIRLTPDSPRLRIDSAEHDLAIGAHSRATVVVDATALAAGRVTLRAQVLAPGGQPMGPSTPLEVTVSPTSQWVYWVLGALAAIALAVGLWRNRRTHLARATS